MELERKTTLLETSVYEGQDIRVRMLDNVQRDIKSARGILDLLEKFHLFFRTYPFLLSNPQYAQILINIHDKLKTVESQMFGQFAELMPLVKHALKGRRVHWQGEADVTVDIENDNYPGKAFQVKTTKGLLQSQIGGALTDAMVQVFGLRRERPVNRRRIILLMLRDECVTWPWKGDLTKIPASEFVTVVANTVNDLLARWMRNDGGEVLKILLEHPTETYLPDTMGRNGKVVKALLAAQFLEGRAQFEVVVIKIVYTNGLLVFNNENPLSIGKIVLVTYATGRDLCTKVVEIKTEDGAHLAVTRTESRTPMVAQQMSPELGLQLQNFVNTSTQSIPPELALRLNNFFNKNK